MARMILQMSLEDEVSEESRHAMSCAISSWERGEEVMYADPAKQSSRTTRQGIFSIPGGKSHGGECFDGTGWCFGAEDVVSWRAECLFVVEARRMMKTG